MTKDSNVDLNKGLTVFSSRRYVIETFTNKFTESIIDHHAYRVSWLCEAMGRQLKLLEREITELSIAGLLHDIGKIAVNKEILDKPGKLTAEEYAEVMRHSEVGYRIIVSVKGMEKVARYVCHHHERWDGKGYPQQLQGEAIPLHSRVISLADAYDAMVNNRSYRKALSKNAAVQELLWNSGNQFDPDLVGEFIKIL
ncbi:HD-GYP domain-containing protein [Desulfitobacterium hafniense]|uniref:HD domain protein n=2 Tax=root TaxID=1 RepID=A0A098AWI9_DESHA|nr:HD-GYP domain-containing protein [Desulfitobacterium hafniense]MEA5021509.1 HD-GYP domain-containing protein [Desulfitobacterium hafniense]CDX00953.1 HD domain protein [Desulfitobacterium hafniense]